MQEVGKCVNIVLQNNFYGFFKKRIYNRWAINKNFLKLRGDDMMCKPCSNVISKGGSAWLTIESGLLKVDQKVKNLAKNFFPDFKEWKKLQIEAKQLIDLVFVNLIPLTGFRAFYRGMVHHFAVDQYATENFHLARGKCLIDCSDKTKLLAVAQEILSKKHLVVLEKERKEITEKVVVFLNQAFEAIETARKTYKIARTVYFAVDLSDLNATKNCFEAEGDFTSYRNPVVRWTLPSITPIFTVEDRKGIDQAIHQMIRGDSSKQLMICSLIAILEWSIFGIGFRFGGLNLDRVFKGECAISFGQFISVSLTKKLQLNEEIFFTKFLPAFFFMVSLLILGMIWPLTIGVFLFYSFCMSFATLPLKFIELQLLKNQKDSF